MLDLTIENYQSMQLNTAPSKVYVDTFYSWANRESEWMALLNSLKTVVNDRSIPKETFSYSTVA